MNVKFYFPFVLTTGLLMACSSGSSSGGGNSVVSNECVETTPLETNGSIQVRNVCDFEISVGRIFDGRLKDVTQLRPQQTTIEFENFDIIACRAPQVPVSIDSCA